jgi:hypothetical protein
MASETASQQIRSKFKGETFTLLKELTSYLVSLVFVEGCTN